MNPFRSSDSAKHYGASGPCITDNTQVRLTAVGRNELVRLSFERNATESKDQTHTPSRELNDTETKILQALREIGHRATTDVLLTKAVGKVNSHGKATLASMVKRELLTSRQDAKPPGYGLPE